MKKKTNELKIKEGGFDKMYDLKLNGHELNRLVWALVTTERAIRRMGDVDENDREETLIAYQNMRMKIGVILEDNEN